MKHHEYLDPLFRDLLLVGKQLVDIQLAFGAAYIPQKQDRRRVLPDLGIQVLYGPIIGSIGNIGKQVAYF